MVHDRSCHLGSSGGRLCSVGVWPKVGMARCEAIALAGSTGSYPSVLAGVGIEGAESKYRRGVSVANPLPNIRLGHILSSNSSVLSLAVADGTLNPYARADWGKLL